MQKVYRITLNKLPHIFLLLMIYVWGCNAPVPPTLEESFTNNIQYLEDQGLSHWAKRSNPKDAAMATFFLHKAYSSEPKNMKLGLLLCRAYHFEGYYVESDPVKKDSLYHLGAKLAISILQKSEVYQSAFEAAQGDSIIKVSKAVTDVEKEYIGALYWLAVNMGRYLSTKPVITRLENREVIEAIMHRILSLDPEYFYGGPYRFFGAFYARLPGVELNRSGEFFQKAIELYPDYLGSYELRAKFLHTKAGKRDLFRADLEYVIQADPAKIPDVMPENLYEQEIARMLLADEEMHFE